MFKLRIPKKIFSFKLVIIFLMLIKQFECLNKLKLSVSDKYSQYELRQSGFTIGQQKSIFNGGNKAILASIQLGTQKQTFKVVLDTGSDSLWVPSVKCSKCPPAKSRFIFDENTEFASTNQTNQIKYITGSVKGIKARDVVQFGDISIQYIFLLVEDQVNMPLQGDGVMGFGRSHSQSNFIKYAFDAGEILSSMFAFKFNMKDPQNSIFYYNFTQQDLPKMNFIDVLAQQEYWYTLIKGISIRQNTYITNKVLFDTGTQYIILPQEFEQEMNNLVFNDYCSDKKEHLFGRRICYSPLKIDYPDLVFEFENGIKMVVEGEDYVTFTEGQYYMLRVEFRDGLDVILGFPFFNKRLIVFNDDIEPKIGIINDQKPFLAYISLQLKQFIAKWMIILVISLGFFIYTKVRPQPMKKDFSDWVKEIMPK